jgi:hypothetical protein
MRFAVITAFVSVTLSLTACSHDREVDQTLGNPTKTNRITRDMSDTSTSDEEDDSEPHDADPKPKTSRSRRRSRSHQQRRTEETGESSADEPRPSKKKRVRFNDALETSPEEKPRRAVGPVLRSVGRTANQPVSNLSEDVSSKSRKVSSTKVSANNKTESTASAEDQPLEPASNRSAESLSNLENASGGAPGGRNVSVLSDIRSYGNSKLRRNLLITI